MSKTDLCAATVAKSYEYKLERESCSQKRKTQVEGRNYHLPVIPLFLALGKRQKRNIALKAWEVLQNYILLAENEVSEWDLWVYGKPIS